MTNLPRTRFASHADEIAHLMRVTTSAEVSPLPIRRPVAVAYPETLGCFCTEEGVAMERLTATDIPGETPAERYERGCNECFVCPECGYQELFPFASMTVADIRRFYPGWGSRRNAGHGDAA